MTILTQGTRTAEFLLSEANGQRSREQGTLAITAAALPAGQLLGTVADEYVAYNPAGLDGSETVTAILYSAAPISAATQPAAVVVRDAEVISAKLTGLDVAAAAELLALGIIVR
ncbi:head decoration protein [Pseudomonas sp. MAP12]|uniref:Head decoration protein n=1 Tax=Geopseudomonas aromaticivorans TaxID=2849492 RepID=A0ABS6MTA2_9GAMM|nr:head decoration protein [Pseudomonas aromaticivorans]MBV2132043.1 head decoration protein [Pseudomonas aromaticivorans]